MRVAYLFVTSGHTASYKLQQMIIPQLREDRYGVDVAGMFFFDDNTYFLQEGNKHGEDLVEIAKEKNILLMLCDQCAFERNLAEIKPENQDNYAWLGKRTDFGDREIRSVTTVDDEFIEVGCFPDLYNALSENPPNNIISL